MIIPSLYPKLYPAMSSGSAKTHRQLTNNEEIVNSITHGIGTLLSIAALIILITVARTSGDNWHLVSYTIYGSTLVLLYLSSTLYHSFSRPRIKNLFARFDHVSIFLLIAGTYTPILLVSVRGVWGWTMFGIIWGIALLGAVIRSIFLHRFGNLMVAIYLLMGWMFVLAGKHIYMSLPSISLTYLVLGGIAYSTGVIFYMWRKLPYGHGIWHLFVLTGSVFHFFAIYYLPR